MDKLKRYAKKSDLMKVKIRYNEEVFEFNLYQEIRIDEKGLNKELLTQPSAYSFLTMLHKKLIKVKSMKEALKERAYSKAYIRFKRETDTNTGRVTANELAKEKAQIDKRFMNAQDEYISTTCDCNVIEACVRAFEQRKDILQTLSANQRKERII